MHKPRPAAHARGQLLVFSCKSLVRSEQRNRESRMARVEKESKTAPFEIPNSKGWASQLKRFSCPTGLEQILQVFGAQARISHDAFQDFGMENFRGVKWNRSTLAFGVLVDHVAAALARYRKTQFFQYGTDFARSQAWKLGH